MLKSLDQIGFYTLRQTYLQLVLNKYILKILQPITFTSLQNIDCLRFHTHFYLEDEYKFLPLKYEFTTIFLSFLNG